MAFTLEATIVVPITMAITVGILATSINLYYRIEMESKIEQVSLIYPIENDELWSCKVNDYSNNNIQIQENIIDNRNYILNFKNNNINMPDKKMNSSDNKTSQQIWSKMISVNPIKEKMFLDLLIDSIDTMKQYLPMLKEMESLFLKESQ